MLLCSSLGVIEDLFPATTNDFLTTWRALQSVEVRELGQFDNYAGSAILVTENFGNKPHLDHDSSNLAAGIWVIIDKDGNLLTQETDEPISYFLFPGYEFAIPLQSGTIMSWDTNRIHQTTIHPPHQDYNIWGSATQISKKMKIVPSKKQIGNRVEVKKLDPRDSKLMAKQVIGDEFGVKRVEEQASDPVKSVEDLRHDGPNRRPVRKAAVSYAKFF
jgi:hypothetical protein